MQKEYPNYRRTGVQFIEDKLDKKEAKILKEFLTYCGMNAGERKVRERRLTLLQIRDVMEIPFDKINLKDIREFLSVLNKGYQRDWTKQGIKVTLQKFLKWKYPNWSIKFNQLEDIRLGKPTTQDKINKSTLITEEELERMLRCAENFRDKAYLNLSFETACRPDEIRHLRWKDFNSEFTEVTLFSGKKREARTLPCQDTTIHIKRWFNEFCYPDLRKDDFVFPSATNRSQPVPPQTTWYMIKKLSKKAGIKKNIYGYLMRHTRLNMLYKTLPEQIHKKFAGHSKDSRQTATYSHIDNDDMMEVILKKVYNVEDLTEDEKNELKQLKKDMPKLIQEGIDSKFKKAFHTLQGLFTEKKMGLLSEKQSKEKLFEFYDALEVEKPKLKVLEDKK